MCSLALGSPSIAVDGLMTAIDPLALSRNENPFPPLPAVRAALIRSVDAVNRYPEFLPAKLRALIADRVGVAHDQVVLGAGATGVAMQVLQTLTRPGDRIVLSYPTFDGYPIIAQMAGLTTVPVPLDHRGHHDLAAMADAAAGARIVVLCRPHNPTGTLEPIAGVERFLRRVPNDTVVLLDEAYIEFVAPEDRLDGPDLVRRHPNVLVLRTFSKAYGLAGLRIGYGFGSPALADIVWGMQLPFGISAGIAVAVASSYDAEDQLQQRIRRIIAERKHLRRRLWAMGVDTTDSHANFVYLPAQGRPWRELFTDTAPRVRCYADGSARITVGNRASTLAVLPVAAKAVPTAGG